MEKDMNKLDLQKKAVDIRKGIISSVHSAKAGHPGGSLSAADIQHRVTIQPLLREDFFRLRIF